MYFFGFSWALPLADCPDKHRPQSPMGWLPEPVGNKPAQLPSIFDEPFYNHVHLNDYSNYISKILKYFSRPKPLLKFSNEVTN